MNFAPQRLASVKLTSVTHKSKEEATHDKLWHIAVEEHTAADDRFQSLVEYLREPERLIVQLTHAEQEGGDDRPARCAWVVSSSRVECDCKRA